MPLCEGLAFTSGYGALVSRAELVHYTAAEYGQGLAETRAKTALLTVHGRTTVDDNTVPVSAGQRVSASLALQGIRALLIVFEHPRFQMFEVTV
jgi:hypothetical protein